MAITWTGTKENEQRARLLLASVRGITDASKFDEEMEKIWMDIPDATKKNITDGHGDMYAQVVNVLSMEQAAKNGGNQGKAPVTNVDSDRPDTAEGQARLAKYKALGVKNENIVKRNKDEACVYKVYIEKEPLKEEDYPATIVVKQPKKLSDYEQKLVKDETNKKAFEALKALINKESPVYISDKPTKKVVGFKAKVVMSDDATPEEGVYMKEQMMAILALKCGGFIATPDSIELKLNYPTPKAQSGAGQGLGSSATSTKTTSPRIMIGEKADVLETAGKFSYVNVRDVDADRVKKTLRTAGSFKINATRKLADGTTKAVEQTVRFSGSGMVTAYKKQEGAEFVNFSNTSGGGNYKHINPHNPQEISGYKDTADRTLTWLVNNSKSGLDMFASEIKDMESASDDTNAE